MAAPAPEQTQANQAVGQAYGDAGATVANQKAALLQAVAQAGQAGKMAHQAQQTQTQNDRTAALGQVAQQTGFGAAPGAFQQQLQQSVAQPGNVAEMVGAGNNPAGYYGAMGKANSDYMDAVGAAVPIAREWTQRQANSIAATAAQEREARAAAIARDKAQSATYPVKLADGTTVMVSGEAALANDRQRSDTTLGEKKAADVQARSNRLVMLRKSGRESSADAISLVMADNPDTYEQAYAALLQYDKAGMLPTSPGGGKLSLNALRGYLDFVFRGEGQLGPAGAGRKPAAPKRVAVITKPRGPLSGVANALGGGPNTASNLRRNVGGLFGLG